MTRADVSTTDLGSLTDAELTALLALGMPLGHGIGGPTLRLDLRDGPVFVKRVPVTDLELAHPRSTANLFGLPVQYQYGVGSTGFNVWRELLAHEITTAYVLAGGTPCFPILRHWRVLPRVPARPLDADYPRWAGLPAVHERLNALELASSSLTLLLEYVPESLETWWAGQDPESSVQDLESQLLGTAAALTASGLLHLDAHPENLLHDGGRVLATDFGLATSLSFDLDDDERLFVTQHGGHDRAYLMTQLVNGLVRRLVRGTATAADRNAWVGGPRSDVDLPQRVREVVERYAPVAVLMNAFYWRLHAGDLQTPYPYEEIDAALARAQP